MRISTLLAGLALLFSTLASAADEPKPRKPCTIKSPSSGLEFDLNGLAVLPKEEGKKGKDEREESWMARGYDYGVNFTINFCAPVIEGMEDVVGVEEEKWRNVSAFYKEDGKVYSIGQQNSELVFRGRKLVLNYTNGSPCDDSRSKRKENDEDKKDKEKDVRRKFTLISFLCDKDTYDSSKPKVGLSFVGASPDNCYYSFEARTPFACGGAAQEEQEVGPGSVFGIIILIALAAYIFGGIAYQRTVMHQRGWRQIPNYSLWAGVASFCKDMFIILFSSCTRCIPHRRGYSQVPSSYGGRGRGSSREDENRLIDQLDEEWDD